jgi:hypothetical protein
MDHLEDPEDRNGLAVVDALWELGRPSSVADWPLEEFLPLFAGLRVANQDLATWR